MSDLKSFIDVAWDIKDFTPFINASKHSNDLKEKTKFLDKHYPEVPVRTRAYVILNEITEVPICPCGCGKPVSINKNKPKLGFLTYHKSSCTNNIKTSPEVIKKLEDKEWLTYQRVNLRKSFDHIADELGTSRSTVTKYIKEHGIGKNVDSRVHSPESRIILEDAKKLGDLYHSGMTTVEIGLMLGVNKQSVNNWLKKHGIPIRNRGNKGKAI